jgi:hypothetical protein
VGETLEISPDLEWIRPYVRSAKRLVPVQRVGRILSYKVPLHQKEKLDGELIKWTGSKKPLVIRILTKVHRHRPIQNRFSHLKVTDGYADRTRDQVSREEILLILAHELSHLKLWEHTARRFHLETKIYALFGRLRLKENLY